MSDHGHSHGHSQDVDEGDPNGPRRTGKLHYHEEEVRPLEAYPLIHKAPHLDLYSDSDRKHPGRDVDLPLSTPPRTPPDRGLHGMTPTP